MKKCLIFILSIALLYPVSASAAESPQYLALIFDGSPRDRETLLTGLEERDSRVTFFFGEGDEPEAEVLRGYGHELGIRTDAGPDMSRRQIAAELQIQEQRLKGRVRLLQTTAGRSDGLRQVAKAMGFSFVEPSGELRLLSSGEDGQILLVDGKMAAITLLEWVDDLRDRGFVFVTVSELARRRGIILRPGEAYRSFPRAD